MLLRLTLLLLIVADGAGSSACLGDLEIDGTQATCTGPRGFGASTLWSATTPASELTVYSEAAWEDTITNCAEWPHQVYGAGSHALRQLVIAGHVAAHERASHAWIKVLLNSTDRAYPTNSPTTATAAPMAAPAANATAAPSSLPTAAPTYTSRLPRSALLFIKGAPYGERASANDPLGGGAFVVRDAPYAWTEANLTCESERARYDVPPYGESVVHAGDFAVGWTVINVTDAARRQYPYMRQLNLRFTTASAETPRMAWFSSKSEHPPRLVVEWGQ